LTKSLFKRTNARHPRVAGPGCTGAELVLQHQVVS
jgi:hypothetical protein